MADIIGVDSLDLVWGIIFLWFAALMAEERTVEANGIVLFVERLSGELVMKDRHGEIVPLRAGSEVDISGCKKGDIVKLRFDREGYIRTLLVI